MALESRLKMQDRTPRLPACDAKKPEDRSQERVMIQDIGVGLGFRVLGF